MGHPMFGMVDGQLENASGECSAIELGKPMTHTRSHAINKYRHRQLGVVCVCVCVCVFCFVFKLCNVQYEF